MSSSYNSNPRIDLRTVSLAEANRLSAQRRMKPLSEDQRNAVDSTALRLGIGLPPPLVKERELERYR